MNGIELVFEEWEGVTVCVVGGFGCACIAVGM